MAGGFQVEGTNQSALFTLRAHRGEGMLLLAMNWRAPRPPDDFVGFGIQYREPEQAKWWDVKNRLSFPGQFTDGKKMHASIDAPIQMFRWVHFPFHAELEGAFTYRVTPVFMDDHQVTRHGEAQEIKVRLARETHPGVLNVTFTRGFVSSQAFSDNFGGEVGIKTLMPQKIRVNNKPEMEDELAFVPTNPKKDEALPWMGFEARRAVLDLLDAATKDTSTKVAVVAYELSQPEILEKLEALGDRLRIVIDNSGKHNRPESPESRAATRLATTAGPANVTRRKMKKLQHNKTIVVTGPNLNKVVCGSTNFSWRGLYVQNNNALVLTGKEATQPFLAAFEQYFASNGSAAFDKSGAGAWKPLNLPGIDARVSFSPHSASNARLGEIAADIADNAKSSVLYSLAFLDQVSEGPFVKAIRKVTKDESVFVYGIADGDVGKLNLQTPSSKLEATRPVALDAGVPPPFTKETAGGSGVRLHHKFVVIDFDQPTARVYLGSYNFSDSADLDNGENLLLIRDRRVAVAYMIEALRIFDHYHFRVARQENQAHGDSLELRRPPSAPGETAWWLPFYEEAPKVRDRELFG